MTRQSLVIVLLAAAALLVLARSRKGQEVTAAVTDAIASNVRGIRNNNPGNIERAGDQWQGMAPGRGLLLPPRRCA